MEGSNNVQTEDNLLKEYKETDHADEIEEEEYSSQEE